MSMPSILNYDTDLSAINQVLAAIGQSPITTINYDNPEHALIANLELLRLKLAALLLVSL